MTTSSTRYTGPERRKSNQPFLGAYMRRIPAKTSENLGHAKARGTESKAKFLGHPLYQQLMVFPLACFPPEQFSTLSFW